MANIYELTGNYLQIQELIEAGDFDADILADTLEGVVGDIEDKADGYAKVMKNLKKDADGMKAEEKRITEKRRAIENHISSLKKNLEHAMIVIDNKKFKTDLFSFNVQKNAPSLVLDDDTAVDTRFIKVIQSIDKAAIKKALENGEVIAYAHLEQSESLRIR